MSGRRLACTVCTWEGPIDEEAATYSTTCPWCYGLDQTCLDTVRIFDGGEGPRGMFTPVVPSPLDVQVGGNHYKNDKIQHAEFSHANGLPYIVANTLKYVMRHRKKNGRQDLDKAKHYLQIAAELDLRYKQPRSLKMNMPIRPVQLVAANGIPPDEAEIIYSVMRYHEWGDHEALHRAIRLIENLSRATYL